MNNYFEKLKDPRWQKKRLKVFERDNWKCLYCGNEKETLMVHHLKYIENLDPWDYPMAWLITLCEKHHKIIHKILRTLKINIFIKKNVYTVKESLKSCFYELEKTWRKLGL